MTLTAEQQRIRSRGIGSSEIAAVAGLNPWMSPLDVYARKLDLAQPDGTFHTERGTYLEPALIAWYASRTGHAVVPANTRVHSRHPVVIATPDGIVEDVPAALEIKAPNWRTAHHWGEPGTDDIPEYYLPQVTWHMAVMGFDRCDVAALIDGDLRIYTVGYDRELFGALLDIASRFWREHIETRMPPAADSSERTKELLASLYPRAVEDVITADDDAAEWAAELRIAKEARKAAEDRTRECEARLKEHIGSHAGMHGERFKISWKNRKDVEKVDYAAIVAELGASDELIAKHTKRAPGPRVFRMTWSKDT